MTQAEFISVGRVPFSLNKKKENIWVRLKLKNTINCADTIAVQVENLLVNSVDFYITSSSLASDHLEPFLYESIRRKDILGKPFRFVLTNSIIKKYSDGITIYLRVQAEPFVRLAIESYFSETLSKITLQEQYLSGAVIGFQLFLTALIFIRFLHFKTKLLGLLMICEAVTTLSLLSSGQFWLSFTSSSMINGEDVVQWTAYILIVRWFVWMIVSGELTRSASSEFNWKRPHLIVITILSILYLLCIPYVSTFILVVTLYFITPLIIFKYILDALSNAELSHETKYLIAISYSVISLLLVMALYLQFFGKTTQYNYRAFGNFLAISQGILAYLIIFLIDKQTQKKKYTLEKQLAAEMIERVDERSAREAHTALIDMLVHEIKNPLATIRIAADNISIIPDNNRSARLNSLNKIFSNVQTVNEVLNQCVVSSQIYGPMAVGPYSQINLAHFLNIIANRNDAQDRVVLDIPSNLYIFSDTYALDIIVSNLISNAMKYGLASSPLVISISNVSVSSSGLIEIEFKNKIGESGVPDPFRVFRRYYRNELSINKSGTGLGLSLSKTLAQKLGGTLFFQPDEFNVIFKLKIPN